MYPYGCSIENINSLDTTASRLSLTVRNQIVAASGGAGATMRLPPTRADILSQSSLLIIACSIACNNMAQWTSPTKRPSTKITDAIQNRLPRLY